MICKHFKECREIHFAQKCVNKFSFTECMSLPKLDMEEQTGTKLGKGYVKAVYCHPDI